MGGEEELDFLPVSCNEFCILQLWVWLRDFGSGEHKREPDGREVNHPAVRGRVGGEVRAH